jgi:hypothetical protein
VEREPSGGVGRGGTNLNAKPPHLSTHHGQQAILLHGSLHPPIDTLGVEDLRSAWKACPIGCTPIILGDLNINFWDTREEREEQIVDLLDKINMTDTSRKFAPQRPCKLKNWER